MTHGEAQTHGKEIEGGEKKLETGKRRMIGLTEKYFTKTTVSRWQEEWWRYTKRKEFVGLGRRLQEACEWQKFAHLARVETVSSEKRWLTLTNRLTLERHAEARNRSLRLQETLYGSAACNVICFAENENGCSGHEGTEAETNG